MRKDAQLPGQVGMDEILTAGIMGTIERSHVEGYRVDLDAHQPVRLPHSLLESQSAALAAPDSPLQKTAFSFLEHKPLSVTLTVSLARITKARKCSLCGLRRILYTIGVSDLAIGSPLCATCAGIR